jgi:hypothetical protein
MVQSGGPVPKVSGSGPDTNDSKMSGAAAGVLRIDVPGTVCCLTRTYNHLDAGHQCIGASNIMNEAMII